LVILNEISDAKKQQKVLSSLSSTPQEQSLVALSQAMIFAKTNQSAEQLTELEKAIKLDDKNIDAILMLARYKYERDELDSAEDLLSQALFALPSTDGMTLQRLQVLRAMVTTLSKQGRSSEAMIYSKLIAEANPRAQELEAEFQKAVEAIKAKDIETANSILENLYSSNPNQTMGAMLGMIKYSQGDFRGASELFDNSIDPETASNQALIAFAATELQLRKPEDAIQAIESNIREMSDNPKLLSLYGLALLFNGDNQKAIDVMEAALELAPDSSKTRLALADALNRSGKQADAMAELEQAYQYDPNDIAIQTRLLNQYEALNKTEKNISFISTLASSKNPQSQALAGLSIIDTDQNRAKELIDEAYRTSPSDIYTINAKLIESIKLDSKVDALSYAEKTLNLEPNHVFALSAAASIKAKTGGESEALEYLTKHSSKSVNNWASEYLISRHYAQKLDFEQSIAHGENALSRSSFSKPISRYIVELYKSAATNSMRSDQPADAKKFLMDALQVSPSDASVFHLLVGIELSEGNIKQAKKIAAQAENQSPDKYVGHLINGDIKKHESQLESAIMHYLDAWQLRPSDKLAKLIWTDLSEDTSIKRSEFLTTWENTIPNSYEAATLRAIDYQQKNKLNEAITQYKRTLNINAKQPIALNNLAWSLYEKRQFQEALLYAERAMQLTPENPAVLDTYALVAHENGMSKEAKAAISKALQLAPDNKNLKTHYDKIFR